MTTIQQQRALAARRAHNMTYGQRAAAAYQQVQDSADTLRVVEGRWAHTPVEVEGPSQMEMSSPEPAVRIIDGIIAVLLIVIGWSCVSWLRHGGMDLIDGRVW